MRKLIYSLMILALGAATPAFAGTIDFENMPQAYWYNGGQQNFGNYWEGVNFGPASTILESQVYGYNNAGYPAHSGAAVLFSINFPYIDAIFDNPVDVVSLWYSAASNFYLDAYDASNNLIATSMGWQNYGSSSFLSVSAESSEIKWVRMHDSGNYFSVDDFTAPFVSGEPNQPVPEPSTFALVGIGTLLVALMRQRFCRHD